jgi:hypothetical protein
VTIWCWGGIQYLAKEGGGIEGLNPRRQVFKKNGSAASFWQWGEFPRWKGEDQGTRFKKKFQ